MECIKAYSQAKLNLRLKVVGRRDDGYHLLDMLNIQVGVADELTFQLSGNTDELDVQMEGDTTLLELPQEQNLVTKVTRDFLERFQLQEGLQIRIQKRIPSGGGLGGGSSNAATTLLTLRELFELTDTVSLATLEEIGLEHGTDIPYLLHGGFARVTGVGEHISQLDGAFLNRKPCILIYPGLHASSAEIYQDFSTHHRDLTQQEESFSDLPKSYDELLSLIDNDLESSLCRCSPPIADLLKSLRQYEDFVVGVTGSGSTLFLLPRDEESSGIELLECFKNKVTITGISYELTELLP